MTSNGWIEFYLKNTSTPHTHHIFLIHFPGVDARVAASTNSALPPVGPLGVLREMQLEQHCELSGTAGRG